METYLLPERLDVTTSPQAEKELLKILNMKKPDTLVCDFSQTVYISSAGLRIMILLAKSSKTTGTKFILTNMTETVYNIFKLSGFTSILDIRDSL